ncbi:hypothetical protein BCR42DRAFT_409851 [Absidia repens]|uniref:Uncharacterized protein n=1 Tax=Absidia repens TaxID=90262 RepID=A0A1X2IN86_9FUNG|nr:hypothetical protein BCR42DRAFT_409851 [Absidia repens]
MVFEISTLFVLSVYSMSICNNRIFFVYSLGITPINHLLWINIVLFIYFEKLIIIKKNMGKIGMYAIVNNY